MSAKILRDHRELEVYRIAFDTAMLIFAVSKSFPLEERYSLTDQIRRSSRSVCSNITEAWRKRRYAAAFIAKLSDAEAEAAETQTWLDFAKACGYIPDQKCDELRLTYDQILGKLITMIRNPDAWTFRQ